MENTFWTALISSSVAAIVTSIGIYAICRFEDWGRKNTTYLIVLSQHLFVIKILKNQNIKLAL